MSWNLETARTVAIVPCVSVHNRDVYHVAANVAFTFSLPPSLAAVRIAQLPIHAATITDAIDDVNL